MPKQQDVAVVKRLHAILKEADLDRTTVKNIQKQLESDLDINLSDRKQFIRDEVRARSSAGTGRFSPARPDRAEGARARRGSDASRRGVARSPDRGGARFSPAGAPENGFFSPRFKNPL